MALLRSWGSPSQGQRLPQRVQWFSRNESAGTPSVEMALLCEFALLEGPDCYHEAPLSSAEVFPSAEYTLSVKGILRSNLPGSLMDSLGQRDTLGRSDSLGRRQ